MLEVTMYATITIALATVCYTIFSGITIKKLNEQNKLLILESHNKLASFLRDEWKNAGFNKIVVKLKNYTSHSFIKSLTMVKTENTKEQIDFYNSIDLLSIDQLNRIIGLTKKINNYIDKDQLNIETILLHFEFLYGDTEWACNENYSNIIYCIKELYKNISPKILVSVKIKAIDDFYTKVYNVRNYEILNRNIIANKKSYI